MNVVVNRNELYGNEVSGAQNQAEIDRAMEEEFPFFTWECISVEFKSSNLDIVIKDELQMKIFIKFLIIHLNSFESSIKEMKKRKLITK